MSQSIFSEKTSLTLRGIDKSVVLTSRSDGGTAQYVFVKSEEGTLVKDMEGKVLVRCYATQDGGMKIYDGNGSFVAECSAAQLERLADAVN